MTRISALIRLIGILCAVGKEGIVPARWMKKLGLRLEAELPISEGREPLVSCSSSPPVPLWKLQRVRSPRRNRCPRLLP